MTHNHTMRDNVSTKQLLGLGNAGGSDEADEVVCSVCWMPQMSGEWGLQIHVPSQTWTNFGWFPHNWNPWGFSLPKGSGWQLVSVCLPKYQHGFKAWWPEV